MAKRKKEREPTIREWWDKLCADAGHEAAVLTVRGRPAFVCFECEAFWLQMRMRGRTPASVAAEHFTAN